MRAAEAFLLVSTDKAVKPSSVIGATKRLADMAKNLILLSGLEPGKDIEIKFTGLKQGEKLHEELMEDPSGFLASEHADIFILRGENQPSPGLDELVPSFRPDAAHTPPPFPRIASPEA